MRCTTLLLLLLAIGCGKAEAKKDAPTQIPKEMKEFAEKAAANAKKIQEEDERKKKEIEAYHESLKTNPQPLFDLSMSKVRSALAESVGDDAAKDAVVTLDEKSLKTFGPNKWMVRGHISTKDQAGKQRETTWEVELHFKELYTPPLNVRSVDLDVKN